MMKKIIISILVIALVFFVAFALLKYTIFTDKNARLIFDEQIGGKSFKSDMISINETYFNLFPRPVLVLDNFKYGGDVYFRKVEVEFPLSFFIHRHKKPDRIIFSGGKLNAPIVWNDLDSLVFVNSLTALADSVRVEFYETRLVQKHPHDVCRLYSVIKKACFSPGQNRKIHVNFVVDSIGLKKGAFNIPLDKEIDFLLDFSEKENETYIKDYHLIINNEEIPLYVNCKNDIWKLLVDNEGDKFSFSISDKGCSFLFSGDSDIWGVYKMKGGYYFNEKHFMEVSFLFNKDYNKGSENKRGMLSGEINIQNDILNIADLEYFGKVYIKKYQEMNPKFPVQLNGVFTIKDNQLTAENATFGYGRSFFKMGGRINRFSEFVFNGLSGIRSQKIKPECNLNITSQFVDFKEVVTVLKEKDGLKRYLLLSPFVNMESYLEFARGAIGEDISLRDGKIKIQSAYDGHVKLKLAPAGGGGDYFFDLDFIYHDDNEHQIDAYYILRQESLAELLKCFYGYQSNNRAVVKLTGNYQNHYNPRTKDVSVNRINGKANIYRGVIKNDPLFLKAAHQYEKDYFKSFSLKYGQLELTHDFLNSENKFDKINLAGDNFSVKGRIYEENGFVFNGNLYVVPENIKYWKNFPNLELDAFLKLYSAELVVKDFVKKNGE